MPCLALGPMLFAPAADAELLVTVTRGLGPAGSSEWIFSGSSTYSELNPGGTFAVVPPLTAMVEWKGTAASDYVKNGGYDNHRTEIVSGSITLTVTPASGPAVSAPIQALLVDHDNSGDDFGLGISAPASIPLTADAVVSWSGQGIFAVDMAKLNVGAFPFTNYGETTPTSSQPFGTLPLTIKVQVPGPLPLLGCGVALSCSRHLRRRVRAHRLVSAS